MQATMVKGQKYLWKLPASDQASIATIASTFNISFPVAQTLLNRGYNTQESVQKFLFTTKEEVFHTSQMKDAQKAVDRILSAIQNKEKILICGDYDVDGITSSALMMICLLSLDAQINFFLPHRVKDGYGLSTRVVERAVRNGYKLLITVDNGITAIEQAKKARELNIDLIITDHHKPHAQVPDAYAVVNPHQHDCPYPFKLLAGVGVTFKILCLLYEKIGKELPSKAYELLLLGTIADVVPLLGENRFWVRHGLTYVNATQSASLKILKENGKLTKEKIGSTDIGFSITPQINALGRLEDARQGVKFLIGTDEQQVAEVGAILLSLNEARKDIERVVLQDIIKKIESHEIDLRTDNVIIAASDQWPPGVIGLVASRLVAAYGKPTILLHKTSQGIVKGSCRSIPEFNMFEALQSMSHLLIQFGGHAQAAGLALESSNLPLFKQLMNERITNLLVPEDLVQKIRLDAWLSLAEVNKKLTDDLQHLEPFGHQNSQPTFYVPQVSLIQKPQLLKDLHVKCMVFAEGVVKPVIFFNRPDLFQTLLSLEDHFALACQLQENHWQGRVSLELQGIDISLQTGQSLITV